MTLPSSGTITLGQVASEFGTSASMSAVRGKGGTPTGTISLSNFYGKSNITFSPSGNQTAGGNGNTYITLSCSQTATWTWSGFPANSVYTSTNISNGGSATAVQFRVGATAATGEKDIVFSVTGVAGGVSKSWSCEIDSFPP